jgi:hypothetical protein
MDYETKVATDKAAKATAELEKRNREVFFEVLCLFPLNDNEANYKLLLAWSGDGVITLEKAEYLIKRKPAGFKLSLTTRERIIEELGELLRNGCSEKVLSAHDFKMWKFRAGTWSLRQLREYRRELALKRTLDTAQKARNYLTEVREGETEKRYPGFPQLLTTVVPRGEVFSRPLDAAYLKSLDAYELKRLCQVYGSEQVTDRLNGRS